VTILVESCALYAVSFILFLGPWCANSRIANVFIPVVAETQVIAPLLITHRVAKQRALTSQAAVPLTVDSIRFKTQVNSTTVNETSTMVNEASTMVDEASTIGVGVGVETTISVPS